MFEAGPPKGSKPPGIYASFRADRSRYCLNPGAPPSCNTWICTPVICTHKSISTFVSSCCCSVISYRHIIFPVHDVLGKVCSECTEAPAVRSHLRRNAGISESFCLVRSCKILLKDEYFPSGFFPCYHSILCESKQIKLSKT